MKGIKMTPTLARALAEKVIEEVNKVRKEQDEKLEVEIRDRKDFKRLYDIDLEMQKLDAEKEKIMRVIKAEYHPKISSIAKSHYGYGSNTKPKDLYSVTFQRPWLNSEVIKNQILLSGTFTADSVDTLVGDAVEKQLKD